MAKAYLAIALSATQPGTIDITISNTCRNTAFMSYPACYPILI